MKIPKSCEPWEKMMDMGQQAKKVVSNCRKDNCLDKKITDEFFRQLAKKGSPTTPVGAMGDANDIIEKDPDTNGTVVCKLLYHL